MADKDTKPKLYPLKPKNPAGFKKAVAWFGGRELVASLKGVVMYAVYGETIDPRSWMKPNVFPPAAESGAAEKIEESRRAAAGAPREARQDDAAREWARKIHDFWKWKRDNFEFWETYLENRDFWKKLDAARQTDFEIAPGEEPLDEFWFDYIADSGDGQTGVYNVAAMCLSDLWLESEAVGAAVKLAPPEDAKNPDETLLPRGYFLFVGGDTAYHSANYATLFERFQTPFRWGFESVRKFLFGPPATGANRYGPNRALEAIGFYLDGETKNARDDLARWDGTIAARIDGRDHWDTEPPRPLFGIPANHDYYDGIDGFNRQFRRSPFDDVAENMLLDGDRGRMVLQIPSFAREQEASYVALRLPFGWWFFGIDSENEKLDFRQEVFFKGLMESGPRKLIVATPEPTTVFGRRCADDDKTGTYLKIITGALGLKQPFWTDGRFEKIDGGAPAPAAAEGLCRLDLSGDVHHYARYWGPKSGRIETERFASEHYASVVAGGGGAFFDVTSTLIGAARDDEGRALAGEIPPQRLFPGEKESVDRTAARLFDLQNIRNGGYIQHAGAIGAIIVFFLLTNYSNVSRTLGLAGGSVRTALAALAENIADPARRAAFLAGEGSDLGAAALLVISLGLTAWAARRINARIALIKRLLLEARAEKAEKAENKPAPKSEKQAALEEAGRISSLIVSAAPLFAGAALYALFIVLMPLEKLKSSVGGLANSVFLLLHLGAAAVLAWLAFEYTNWLAVRFKLSRQLARKTFTERLEDLNEDAAAFLDELRKTDEPAGAFKKIVLRIDGGDAGRGAADGPAAGRRILVWLLKTGGLLARAYSYKYFPAAAVALLAVAALVFGIGIFGDEPLGRTLADLLLIFVVLGEFYLLAATLARGTGAAYLDGRGKKIFLLLGSWHAALQLGAPFVVFCCADWPAALAIFALVAAFSGLPLVNRLSGKAGDGEAQTFAPLGERLMKACYGPPARAWTFFAAWALFGIVTIGAAALPLGRPSLEQLIDANARKSAPPAAAPAAPPAGETNRAGALLRASFGFVVDKSYFWLSFLVVGLIGHRLSRVWFGWYLAAAVLFNGHNNEAGGLARIEGFKHILRVRITPEKLTVYVIGIDEARADLEDLQMRLVDRFDLKPVAAGTQSG